jgi:hypothetical protein
VPREKSPAWRTLFALVPHLARVRWRVDAVGPRPASWHAGPVQPSYSPHDDPSKSFRLAPRSALAVTRSSGLEKVGIGASDQLFSSDFVFLTVPRSHQVARASGCPGSQAVLPRRTAPSPPSIGTGVVRACDWRQETLARPDWARSRPSGLGRPPSSRRSRSGWDRYCRWARRPSAEAAGETPPTADRARCAESAALSERLEQESREEQVMVVRPLGRPVSVRGRPVRWEQMEGSVG